MKSGKIQNSWSEHVENNKFPFLFGDETLSEILKTIHIFDVIPEDNTKLTVIGFADGYGVKLIRKPDSFWYVFVNSRMNENFEMIVTTRDPLYSVLETFDWLQR